MKKYTRDEIKQILADINAGTVYVIIRGNCAHGAIYKIPCRPFIQFRDYGQFACKNTISDFISILNNVICDCDEIVPGHYSEYHIGYIADDPKFRAIDYSRSHPNVYGL